MMYGSSVWCGRVRIDRRTRGIWVDRDAVDQDLASVEMKAFRKRLRNSSGADQRQDEEVEIINFPILFPFVIPER